MLHYQTIESCTLELLKNLMSVPELSHLRLVGGTSLALQIGHRKSIDLDLFGALDLEPEEIPDILTSYGVCSVLKNSRNIHIFTVNGIKVDIVNYKYPWLIENREIDGLRLASLEDIAAMKMSAITGRGTRKDFIDLYFLLQYFPLQKMLDLYMTKYADGSSFLVIKSLTYYNDAEAEPMPYMFKEIDWEQLKERLNKEVSGLI